MREMLIELIEEEYYCSIEELADHLIANGVTTSAELEELKADNERLRNMWAKAVSDASKAEAENKASRWIPVTERLPEPFEVVLVYDHTGKSINWAYMTRHREWVGVIVSHIVTHWMPLPEPPKGE